MSNNNDGGGCGLLILLIAFGYILLWILAALAVAVTGCRGGEAEGVS